MRGYQRILAGIGFSVAATMASMAIMSRFPGLEIPLPYWIFGFCAPLFISTPVCLLMHRQAEQKRRLNVSLHQALIELRHLTEIDQMTGLLNRATFLARLAVQKDARPGACLLIDVDHFKAINDAFGHAVGDRVLKAIAERLQSSVRKDDLCGRLGGEEFAIYLAGVGEAEAAAMAERLCQAVSALAVETHDVSIRPTISIGAAHACGSPDADHMLQRADMAMYRAKANGRNQVRLAA
ncbi:GGDEF domain-containing protein [Sphingobium sp. HBC34]|uniref:diguanylate cyclase n=1 Tax=Sphingobium cyanobacteriorum TaxID=3063954 RepID=A0ABT8ZNQ9_9SPHN|nr:GGDEF domain-containing protein [Sphingobium sp. HBC34]MDO7836172.1 GGDEF domain-containing protein [Sphingobium sp. HBC34]